MKTFLKILVLFAVAALTIPSPLLAKEPTLEQVRQNVVNMQQSMTKDLPSITAKNFKKVLESDEEFVLLDVRSEDEFNAAHLPGALNVDRGRLEWIIPNIILKTDRTIYVYSQDGKRSAFATELLIQMGYRNAVNIVDGFEAWVTAGYYVYNMHGEFIMTTGGYKKREPIVGNLPR